MFNFDLVIQKEKVFALEISKSYVRVMKLDGNIQKMHTSSFIEVSIPKSSVVGGVIRRKKIVADAIRTAVFNAYPNKVKTPYVITALPDEKVFVKVEEFPYLEKDELKDALDLKVENILAMPLDKVYWDWHRIYSSKKDGKILVLIAAVEKECADSFLDTIDLAGLTPLDFEIPASAAGRAVVTKEYINEPHLLINMGESSTAVSIWDRGGIYFNTSIRVGRDQLQKVFYDHISDKTRYEEKISKININKISDSAAKDIESSMTSLVSEIKNVINYHEEKYKKQMNGILFFGSGSEIDGIDKYISERIQRDITYANPKLNIYPKPQLISHKKLYPHVVLVGLALRGIKGYKEVSDINLLPIKTQKKYVNNNLKESIFNNLIRVGLNNIFLALVLGVFIVNASTHNTTLEASKNEAEKLLYSTASLQSNSDIKELSKDIDNYEKLFSNRYMWTNLLKEIGVRTPSNISLTDITISQNEALTFGDKKKNPKEISYYLYIEGKTSKREDLLDYYNSLNNSAFFISVKNPLANYETDLDAQNLTYDKFNNYIFKIEAKVDINKVIISDFIKAQSGN